MDGRPETGSAGSLAGVLGRAFPIPLDPDPVSRTSPPIGPHVRVFDRSFVVNNCEFMMGSFNRLELAQQQQQQHKDRSMDPPYVDTVCKWSVLLGCAVVLDATLTRLFLPPVPTPADVAEAVGLRRRGFSSLLVIHSISVSISISISSRHLPH